MFGKEQSEKGYHNYSAQNSNDQSSLIKSKRDQTEKLKSLTQSISKIVSAPACNEKGEISIDYSVLKELLDGTLSMCASFQANIFDYSRGSARDPSVTHQQNKSFEQINDVIESDYQQGRESDLVDNKEQGVRIAEISQEHNVQPATARNQQDNVNYQQIYQKYKKYKQLFLKEHQKSERYKRELRDILSRFK